jgi:ketosteroid isomerase-like protein
MRNYILIGAAFLLISCKTSISKIENNKIQINETLNSWHKAATNSAFETYFSLMTSDGVFIGTDATENWQNDAFRAFSKPYFDKGKAWNFNSLQRNIYINSTQNIAWFDELLDTQMKICRGSGTLIKVDGKWKIAHYVLSMTVPNDKITEVVKIKDEIESDEISRLKRK